MVSEQTGFVSGGVSIVLRISWYIVQEGPVGLSSLGMCVFWVHEMLVVAVH